MSERTWPSMIWIGGAPGAGKSTLARTLSHTLDLPLHPIDLWTYDHAARLNQADTLDDELTCGPEYAANAFEAHSRARLELVIADVVDRDLGAVPAIVEGTQLSPAPAEALPAGFAVWLVPDPARTRQARERRIDVPGSPVRFERLLARDAVLAERIRNAATAAGRPVIEVPAEPDWSLAAERVRAAIGPALSTSPRLEPGAGLAGQRRFENLVACRQGRSWQAAVGLAALPPFPFACECGRGGCARTWSGTPDEYDVVAADGPVVADGHDE